ncbi:hypothetical protein [Shinella sp. NM-101]|uniref:hypothetical protein n=1 Tax=Shinella sp. NM-101 TaxID=2744455 RepID=UPI001F351AC8|nr:hypothetical protein [Shinella sp. NM-101]
MQSQKGPVGPFSVSGRHKKIRKNFRARGRFPAPGGRLRRHGVTRMASAPPALGLMHALQTNPAATRKSEKIFKTNGLGENIRQARR